MPEEEAVNFRYVGKVKRGHFRQWEFWSQLTSDTGSQPPCSTGLPGDCEPGMRLGESSESLRAFCSLGLTITKEEKGWALLL